jgi:nicotinamidase/pyrazinamidase
MKTMFWCVNPQEDFFEGGSIKLSESDSIKPKIRALTTFAKENKLKVVNVVSWNKEKEKWFSDSPDFVKSFPPHCIENSKGTNIIPEALPENDYFLIKNDAPYIVFPEIHKHRNIIIFKNAINLIEGNKFADSVLNNLGTMIMDRPKYFVYGIGATMVARDLSKRGYEVKVISDATVDFPGFEINLEENNILTTTTQELFASELE